MMMNNFDLERIQLIDISLEDDFLIDQNLDDPSFDFRLSVSLDAEKELHSDPKSRVHQGMKDRVSSLVKEERVCNPRKSLAWDQSFFTSPGILEFEELCLVNSGFRNLEVSSSLGIEDNVKGKVNQGRNLSHKSSVGAEGRQKTRSSMKTKVASPSKSVSMQSSKRQQMNTGRSDGYSAVVAKSQLVQSTSSRKELSLKSTRTLCQSSLSTTTIAAKKPPLRALNKKAGLATNISADFSPYKTTPNNRQTASVARSLDIQGKGISESYSSTSAGSQKSGIKQSPLSSETSSLRAPSKKIGYFDMKPEIFKHDQDGAKHLNSGQRTKNQPLIKKKTQSVVESEEKENILHPQDTIIEFELKKHSPSPSRLSANSSPTSSSGQCSSSSKKSLSKMHQSIRETLLSPIRGPKTPFLAKFSPLKKRSIF